MKYLVDSNIWLERLLNQARSEEVKEFLEVVPSDHLCISDFSLHSIGIILYKFKEIKIYPIFVDDLFYNGRINLLTLTRNQLKSISDISSEHNLDFDDSYQYVVAENNFLEIVSFDKDLKSTPLGKLVPKDIISKYKK